MLTNQKIESNTYYAEKRYCLHDRCRGHIIIIDDYDSMMYGAPFVLTIKLKNYVNSLGNMLEISLDNTYFYSVSSNEEAINELLNNISDAMISNVAYNPTRTSNVNALFKKVHLEDIPIDLTYCLSADIDIVSDLIDGAEIHGDKTYLCRYMSAKRGACKDEDKRLSNIYCNLSPSELNIDNTTFNTPVFYNRCTACNLCIKMCGFAGAIRNVYTKKVKTIQEVDSEMMKSALLDTINYCNREYDLSYHTLMKSGIHGILADTDSSKPSNPSVNSIFYAMDTKKMYYCFQPGYWTEITETHSLIKNTHGITFGGAPLDFPGVSPLVNDVHYDTTNGRLYICRADYTWSELVYPSSTTPTAMNSFGLSGSIGTSPRFARQDHRHSTPANPVTAHNVALNSGVHACQSGTEISRPNNCAVGDMYFASDTKRLYRCFTTNNWVLIGEADLTGHTGKNMVTGVHGAVLDTRTNIFATTPKDGMIGFATDTLQMYYVFNGSGDGWQEITVPNHNHDASNINAGSLNGDRLAAPTTTKKGGVPAILSTHGDKYLRADGVWQELPINCGFVAINKDFPAEGIPTLLNPNAIADIMIVYPFNINMAITVSEIYVLTEVAVTDAINFAIYDKGGTRLYRSGVRSTVLNNFISDSLSLTLTPDKYYFAITNGGSTSLTDCYRLSPRFDGGCPLPGYGAVDITGQGGSTPTSFDPSKDIDPWEEGFPIYVYLYGG